MNILSKDGRSAVDIQALAATDPIAVLDGVIHELKITRDAAMRASSIANGAERTELRNAIADLETKLALAHQKRDEVKARLERTARIRELSAEMQTLSKESEAASAPGARDEARLAAVKNRIEEIRVEAQALALKSG